eukprot:3164864-Alexandrium_andersonii.AAC.1
MPDEARDLFEGCGTLVLMIRKFRDLLDQVVACHLHPEHKALFCHAKSMRLRAYGFCSPAAGICAVPEWGDERAG